MCVCERDDCGCWVLLYLTKLLSGQEYLMKAPRKGTAHVHSTKMAEVCLRGLVVRYFVFCNFLGGVGVWKNLTHTHIHT